MNIPLWQISFRDISSYLKVPAVVYQNWILDSYIDAEVTKMEAEEICDRTGFALPSIQNSFDESNFENTSSRFYIIKSII